MLNYIDRKNKQIKYPKNNYHYMPNLDIVNNIRKKDDGDDDREGFFSAGKTQSAHAPNFLLSVFYCNLNTDNVIHIM